MNIGLFVISLILGLSSVILMYKYLGKTGLLLWVALATVVSNIQTVKLISVFGLETAVGNILYGSVFLATDILNLKYGEKEAKKSILVGFIAMVMMTVFMTICLIYKPSPNDFANESLKTIFTVNIRITIASIFGFIVSQYMDAKLFHKLQKKYKKLWLSNNASTIVCQLLDTIIFVTITYLGLVDIKTLLMLMLTMYIFKVIVAILDTPFIYISSKIKPKKEF